VPQRILVHDYSGHPFQPQLSRRLAARGHVVLHAHSESVQIPQGALTKTKSDPSSLRFEGIRLPTVVNKQAYAQRFFQERAYGRLLENTITEFRPDVVISSSTPLDAQATALDATKRIGGKFVFWLQDIQGVAIERLLGAKFHGMGRLIGQYYTGLEKRLLRKSDAVVSITEDFAPTLSAWEVPPAKIHVIPNWASIDELPQRPKDNAWARTHGLSGKFVFLYSGTIGLKHNPELLLKLALVHRDHPLIAVVVISEGVKADWLREQKARLRLGNLLVLPFQPYADVPNMMGTADVLVAVLDPDAGSFSVPSKVLSYHCAGRPLLLSVPLNNLAARIVEQSNSGVVVSPGDVEGFLRKAEELRSSPETRRVMAENALRYARQTFNLDRITDRFEALFKSLVAPSYEERGLANERA
jgi:glycosyltransferase involved in cell wall biosynthesis